MQKKCTRIVHESAQMDNGRSVDGPLYTGDAIQMALSELRFC